MKRFVSVILLTALFMLSLVACQGDDESSASGTELSASDSDNEYKDADGNYVPNHEVKNLEGKPFTVIVRGEGYGTYASDDFVTNTTLYGELIEEAVQKRDDAINRLYNIELNVEVSNSVYADVLLDCQSSLGSYDAIMPSLSELSSLAIQGYLWDLSSLKNFDVNAPWYDKSCTETFSINDQVYFTTGDITILNKVNTPHVYYHLGH